jgi:hypothetical protein
MKLLEIISVDLDVTDQPLIRFPALVRCWRKKWEYSETIYQLFIECKEAYNSVRRELLYSNLIESGVLSKLVRLIKMCLNETQINVCLGKHLLDSSLFRMI